MYNSNSFYLAASSEIQALDQKTIESGKAGIELMESAGAGIYQKIKSNLDVNYTLDQSNVLIFCGSGNNGGDGLTIALEMLADNISPTIITIDSKNYSPEYLIQHQKLTNTNILPFSSTPTQDLTQLIESSDIIIDAMLGTGQKEAPRGDIANILDILSGNTSHAYTIAVDLPTGVHSDNGQLLSENAFKANLTVCIEMIKRGLLQDPARSLAGQLQIACIDLVNNDQIPFQLTAPSSEFKLDRPYSAHKGTAGHVFVIGGSQEYPGAPILTSHAAYKSGAGLVTKLLFSINDNCLYPEIVNYRIESNCGYCTKNDADMVLKACQDKDILVIGPGLGTNSESYEFLDIILSKNTQDKVIDADAINFIAELCSKQLKRFNFNNTIFTPHPGEAARLLGVAKEEVQKDRYNAAIELHEKYGAIVVLKGAGTVIVSNEGSYVNPYGNPYMATAGSGDVLSGCIAAFALQGFSLTEAARYGVAIHGVAGNFAVKKSNGAILASEISNNFGNAIKKLSYFRELEDFDLYIDELNFLFI